MVFSFIGAVEGFLFSQRRVIFISNLEKLKYILGFNIHKYDGILLKELRKHGLLPEEKYEMSDRTLLLKIAYKIKGVI